MGWTVPVAIGARSVSTSSPRSRVTRKPEPSSVFAAVAPRHTMIFGFTTWSSASSHGRHAAISSRLGL